MGTEDAERGTDWPLERAVTDRLMEGCQVISPDWRYLFVSETVAAQARRARSELLGRTMMECFPGIDNTPMFERLKHAMTSRNPDAMQNEFTYPDGSTAWFHLLFLPVSEGVCILSLDITATRRAEAALRRVEEQLRHAQKMDALGRLASGVAHDLNNMLSVVLSYSALALENMADADPLRKDVVEIKRAGERGAELTRQLMAFARQDDPERRLLDPGALVAGMAAMLRRVLGTDIRVTVDIQPGVGSLLANRGQLEQVLMNLALNARDAMPDGGRLVVELRDVEVDAEFAAVHLGVRPGPYVLLAVTDEGIGMDAETRARIFDPFFTTKPVGRGTGLGLATVFGIVRQHEGAIWVYSEPRRGSTFKVYLPRSSTQQVPDLVMDAPTVARGGTECILLVDDDAHVRQASRTILERHGYRVLEAADEAAVTELLRTHDGVIDLLLTDVVMPGLSGPELAERLRVQRPGLRVLFSSGYTGAALEARRQLPPGARFLSKPITPSALLSATRGALDAPAGA